MAFGRQGDAQHERGQDLPPLPPLPTLPDQPAPRSMPDDLSLPAGERAGSGGEPFAAAPPVEESAAAALPGPFRLNRALGLKDAPVKVYGWIQNSFTYNANGRPASGTNFPVYPNLLANQWMGNQYYLVLEKPLEDEQRVQAGLRVDVMFGNDWVPVQSRGIFDYALPYPPGGFQGFDLPQFYGHVHLPWFTDEGLDIKAGRFYTIAGYEGVPAVGRPLLSWAYLERNTPFTWFGALTTLHVSDRVNLYNAAVSGPDRFVTENYRWSYMGGIGWTSKSEATTVNLTIVTGGANQLPNFPRDQAYPLPTGVATSPALALKRNLSYDRNVMTFLDGVVTHKWNDRFRQACETFMFLDQNVPGAEPGDPTHNNAWYGFANWFLYDFTDKVTGVYRAEVFRDDNGATTGTADTYYEMTLGLWCKPREWLWIRPEARYDWAQFHAPFSDGTRSSQFTLGFDVVVMF